MARSSSQSQSSVGGAAGSRPSTVGPRGTPAAAAGMRRRRATATGGGGGFSGGGGGGSNMLRFYTDEAPGLRLSPTMVLVMSLCFIGFVTALHVFGKLYRSRTAAASA
ncbi:protein transport protein Sec61 subunit beta-like [Phragmites australis]|uniref:protein transport protein Sec61 subunit beta-like n=1 Tax=Phragmites australis TaxID=29695 RepID=UPI002D77349E|nr:protein transport protein Sec61 subunit beta-like [Phragmites australis]